MSDETTFWVSTVPTKKGHGFLVQIQLDDLTVTLNEHRAMLYAAAVLRAAAYAEYDHSVYTQMRARFDHDHAFSVVRDLQNERPPLELKDSEPLLFLPALQRDDARTPVVLIRSASEQKNLGTWALDQAREHAFVVVEAVAVSELDGAYLRTLRGTIGLDEDTARAVVGELSQHRPPRPTN